MDQTRIVHLHLRVRNNGIAQDRGGYTLAIKRRADEKWSVGVAQCPQGQLYNKRIGETVATSRLAHGKYMVLDNNQLVETVERLNDKINTGDFKPRIDLDFLFYANKKETNE